MLNLALASRIIRYENEGGLLLQEEDLSFNAERRIRGMLGEGSILARLLALSAIQT